MIIWRKLLDFVEFKSSSAFCKICSELKNDKTTDKSNLVNGDIKIGSSEKRKEIKKLAQKLDKHSKLDNYIKNVKLIKLKNSMKTTIQESFSREKETIKLLFNTSYFIAMNKRPFTDYSKILDFSVQ